VLSTTPTVTTSLVVRFDSLRPSRKDRTGQGYEQRSRESEKFSASSLTKEALRNIRGAGAHVLSIHPQASSSSRLLRPGKLELTSRWSCKVPGSFLETETLFSPQAYTASATRLGKRQLIEISPLRLGSAIELWLQRVVHECAPSEKEEQRGLAAYYRPTEPLLANRRLVTPSLWSCWTYICLDHQLG
jgi:hypothetical protein